MIKIYCGGTFDLAHFGHLNFFYNIKKLFPISHITVALNTDYFVQSYKGKKPIFNYEERKEQLLLCPYIDEVVENTFNEDSKPTILAVKPNIIAVGSDWADRDYCKQMQFDNMWLAENDFILMFIPNKKIVSSTIIKNKIKHFKV